MATTTHPTIQNNPNTTTCSSGSHTLTCVCGDTLTTIPRGNEWAWKSTATGNTTESATDPEFERLGWDGLAAENIHHYAHLRVVGTRTYHTHEPLPCPDTNGHIDPPRCCDQWMRLTPQGWVCRNNSTHTT